MKKTFTFLLLLLVISSSFIKEKDNENYSQTVRVIIAFDNEYDDGNKFQIPYDIFSSKFLKNLLKQNNIKTIDAVFKNRYNNDGNKIPFNLKESILEKDIIYRQITLTDVKVAKKILNLIKREKIIKEVYLESPISFKKYISANDPEKEDQWYLNTLFGISLDSAWDINKGRNDVIIAVCDGGVDYTHPDLDLGDRSKIIQGYDTGDKDNDPLDDLPYNDPQSFAGHGTSVAGVIGALTNNNIGISGIMWNGKIMPVKMVRDNGISVKLPFSRPIDWNFSATAFPSDVADAIDYAVNNGANVINLSYGFIPGDNFLETNVIYKVPLVASAISKAYLNNVVVVAAMGNEGQEGSPKSYPAAFTTVIAVGNTDQSGNISATSSIGPHISVSAPGTNIHTTQRGGGYDLSSGTSLSAPVVSGVAGLIISQGKDKGFNLTNEDVKEILERTARDRGEIGFDSAFGHGIVNAYEALNFINNPNKVIHGSSTGGTATYLRNFSNWIIMGGLNTISSGAYFNVDQYRIMKHIEFDTPFIDTPTVWLRERGSVCFSYANPNSGRPFTIIRNITPTGFDVEYCTYYVRNSSSGQILNKWVPAAPGNTKIEYTAVGIPGFKAEITGPSTICTQATYTIQNLPQGATVQWSVNDNNVATIENNGSNATVSKTIYSTGGVINLTADISIGEISNTISKQVMVGTPSPYVGGTFNDGGSSVNQSLGSTFNVVYNKTVYISLSGPANEFFWEDFYSNGNVTWSHPVGRDGLIFTFNSPITTGTYFSFNVSRQNECGIASEPFFFYYAGNSSYYKIAPNPSSTNINISLKEDNSAYQKDTDKIPTFDQIVITDITGNIKLRQNVSKTNRLQVDVSRLSNGIYYLNLYSNGKLIEKKTIQVAK